MSNFTICDIFLKYADKHKLLNEQWKVFNAIRNCGTENLGYHTCTCKECGDVVIDAVLCARAMLVKNGFKKNQVIY